MRAEFADRSIEKGLNAGWITKDDVALIKEFITGKKASSGIGLSRVNKITYTLVHWRRFLPEYRGMTIADVYEGIDAMKIGISTRGTPFKQNPKHDFEARALRSWCCWSGQNLPCRPSCLVMRQ